MSSKTTNMKLRILQTKAWAWTCAYSLSESPGNYLGAKALARAANNKNIDDFYDGPSWTRWRNGKHHISPRKLRGLWIREQGAHDIGPWAEGTFKNSFMAGANLINKKGEVVASRKHTIDTNFIGGFVPLWSTISGTIVEMIQGWRNIPIESWIAWAPCDDSFPTNHDYDYVPERIKNEIQLFEIAKKLSQSEKQIPPLLAFTAAIAVARLKGNKTARLFDIDPKEEIDKDLIEDSYLTIDMHDPTLGALSKLKINFGEIAEICLSNDLIISDCCSAY